MKNLALCFLNVALLVCGQLLFKLGARDKTISSLTDILRLLLSPYMITAIALYVSAALLWIYILTKLPISYAYPIQALAFPLVVIISVLLFRETVPANRWVGIAVIIVGVLLASK